MRTLAALLFLLLATALLGSPAQADTPCQPGTGRSLAGRMLTDKDMSRDMRCADLRGARLTGVKAAQIDLSGANLDGADLTGASLIQAKLAGASLRSATLRSVTLIQATLTGADFTGAQLSGANLTQATLTGANFTDASLAGAQLIQARGTNVNLTRTNLAGANRTQAAIEQGPGIPAPDRLPAQISRISPAHQATEEPALVAAGDDSERWQFPVSARSALLTGGVLVALAAGALAVFLLSGAGRGKARTAQQHSGIEIGDAHMSSGRGAERHPYEAPPL